MPGQSPISSLLSLNTKASPARPQSAAEGDGFRRAFEGTVQGSSKGSAGRPQSPADTRPEHQSRSESREPAQSSASETRQSRADHPREAGEGGHSRSDMAADKSSSRKPEDSPATQANSRTAASGTKSEPGDSEKAPDNKTDLLESAESVLAALSEEDWSALAEDVSALLGELKAKVDAGELTPELEEALHQLLADLETGAPLEQVAKSLDAIPLSVFPELANQFPGAQTIREALGRSGAAYLTQLSALVKQGMTAASRSEAGILPAGTLSKSEVAGENTGRLELASLLELSASAGKNGKEAFAQTLQALADNSARPASRASTSFESGQVPANALAQLDGTGRSQPLTPTERGFTVQTDVRVPVNQGQWGQAVGQKVLWMASQKLSSAELRLDPPDLGPMQVRVSSHQDQITVTFTSHQAAVREALDQNANRLREMFAEQGLDLVDVNVSDQSGQEQTADEGEGRAGGQGGRGDAEDSDTRLVEMNVSDRLVDHYA